MRSFISEEIGGFCIENELLRHKNRKIESSAQKEKKSFGKNFVMSKKNANFATVYGVDASPQKHGIHPYIII